MQSTRITSTGMTMSDSVDDVVFVNQRKIEPGTEVSIKGKRGRFRFVNATHTSDNRLVLNFVGGRSGHEMMRSFYPEQVKRVHRLTRTRENWKEDDPNA